MPDWSWQSTSPSVTPLMWWGSHFEPHLSLFLGREDIFKPHWSWSQLQDKAARAYQSSLKCGAPVGSPGMSPACQVTATT